MTRPSFLIFWVGPGDEGTLAAHRGHFDSYFYLCCEACLACKSYFILSAATQWVNVGVALLEWVLKHSISARYIRPTSQPKWTQPEMVGVALLNTFRWPMCSDNWSLDNWSLDNWLPIRYCWRKSPHTYQTTAKGKMTSPTPWRHVLGHSEWQLMVENNDNGYINYQRCPKGVWKSHQRCQESNLPGHWPGLSCQCWSVWG